MYVRWKNEKALASTLLLPLPLKVGHKSQTKIHTKKNNLERKKRKKVNQRANREGVKKNTTTEGGSVVVYVAVVKQGRRNKQKAITD